MFALLVSGFSNLFHDDKSAKFVLSIGLFENDVPTLAEPHFGFVGVLTGQDKTPRHLFAFSGVLATKSTSAPEFAATSSHRVRSYCNVKLTNTVGLQCEPNNKANCACVVDHCRSRPAC